LASVRSEKARMARMYDRLGRVYGKRRRTNLGTTLEQLIFTVLTSGAKEPQAIKALNLLQEEYVDWNEVRICPEDILREDLNAAGVNSAAPGLLKDVLEGLFHETASLEPEILDGYTPQQFTAILSKINFPKALTASLLLSLESLPKSVNVPIDSGVARVMVRTGFVRTARATNEIKRCIERMLPGREHPNFHRIVACLSQNYCVNGEPNCRKCPVRNECIHYKTASSADERASAKRRSDDRLRQTVAPRRSRPPSRKR
jgi:endonuclease III